MPLCSPANSPSSTTRLLHRHLQMVRTAKSEAAKRQINCRKVAERHQAAIKEYQSCVTTGPLGILELHIMHGGCKIMLIRQQNMPRILQSGS